MTARGVAVAGYDLRGHGKNPGNSAVAFFGKEGWEATLQDMHRFLNNLAARFPGIPHHLLGFSPGSFLHREYLGKWPDIVTSAMIMGTDNQPGVVLSIMMAIVKEQIKKGGFDDPTDRVRELSFRECSQNSWTVLHAD